MFISYLVRWYEGFQDAPLSRSHHGWSFRSWTFILLTHAREDDSLLGVHWLMYISSRLSGFALRDWRFLARMPFVSKSIWPTSITTLRLWSVVLTFLHLKLVELAVASLIGSVVLPSSLFSRALPFLIFSWLWFSCSFFSLWVMRGSQSYTTKNDLFIPFYSFPPVDSSVESSTLVMIWTGKSDLIVLVTCMWQGFSVINPYCITYAHQRTGPSEHSHFLRLVNHTHSINYYTFTPRCSSPLPS